MITASLVTYFTKEKDLRNILDCVNNSAVDELYVIDNSKSDSIRDFFKNQPKVRYVESENLGYGHGHNVGFNMAYEKGSKYHIVLNPDIIFGGVAIDGLKEFMDKRDDVGLVMPHIIYPNGETQYLCKLLPTPFDLIIRRFLPDGAFKKSQKQFEMRASGYDKEMEVPYLSGCFMFFRTSILKEVGGFDERFFMYGEDIDLSRRVHEKSKTMYFPAVNVIHAHERASYKSKKMLIVHIKNLIKYFNKWGWVFDGQRKKINKRILRSMPID